MDEKPKPQRPTDTIEQGIALLAKLEDGYETYEVMAIAEHHPRLAHITSVEKHGHHAAYLRLDGDTSCRYFIPGLTQDQVLRAVQMLVTARILSHYSEVVLD